MLEVLRILGEKFQIQDFNLFFVNLALAIILLVFGFVLGRFVKYVLKKAIYQANLDRTIRASFIDLFLTVIKWAIYVLFVNLALIQVGIPQFTEWITSILVVIPALVGALILIAIGFAIAVYLREVIEESQILGWKTLSKIFFYFVIYVFMIFAIKTALLSQSKELVNTLVIVLTAIIAAGVTYWHIKKH